jgi:hypothetical protein
MSSISAQNLKKRLREIDEIVSARDAICPAGAGKPAERKGAAVLKAGTTLLSALLEAYVEELYELSLDKLHPSRPTDVNELKKHTSEKNHNANIHQINNLFFYVGIPWIMSETKVRWQKCANSKVQKTLAALAKARNEIAHGNSKRTITKKQLAYWRVFVERLADRLDEVVADHIEARIGQRPW